jgi:hypothetical protein
MAAGPGVIVDGGPVEFDRVVPPSSNLLSRAPSVLARMDTCPVWCPVSGDGPNMADRFVSSSTELVAPHGLGPKKEPRPLRNLGRASSMSCNRNVKHLLRLGRRLDRRLDKAARYLTRRRLPMHSTPARLDTGVREHGSQARSSPPPD